MRCEILLDTSKPRSKATVAGSSVGFAVMTLLQECRSAGMVVLQTTVDRNGGTRTYNTRNVRPTVTADLHFCNITYRIGTPGISGPSLANSEIERTSFISCMFF